MEGGSGLQQISLSDNLTNVKDFQNKLMNLNALTGDTASDIESHENFIKLANEYRTYEMLIQHCIILEDLLRRLMQLLI